MNKQQFLSDTEVNAFINWLSSNFSKLKINLKIKKSRFVPEPINTDTTGIDAVLQHYKWKSSGMLSGNWAETKNRLDTLSSNLKNAVKDGSEDDALEACKNILAWGGNRNWNVGAYPFLLDKANKKTLCSYITKTGSTLNLCNADTTNLATVEKMNAMLTKVHALYASDGLPIYDSRVAAAIASLVELWRIENDSANKPLSELLSFPATISTRSVYRALPNAQFDPGLLGYDNESAIWWASAKVRLGFVLQAILEKNDKLFSAEKNRMHAFEACLFMIGYNVSCLTNFELDYKLADKKSRALQRKIFTNFTKNEHKPSNPDKEWVKLDSTLNGKGQSISYCGNLEIGYSCLWGGTKYLFEPEMLNELIGNFAGKTCVPLGASQDGSGPDNSLGIWLNDENELNPRYGSVIASILVNDGHITYEGKKPIFLNFSKFENNV